MMWIPGLTKDGEVLHVVLRKNRDYNMSCYDGHFRLRLAGSSTILAEYNSETASYATFTVPSDHPTQEAIGVVEVASGTQLLMPLLNGHEFGTKWSDVGETNWLGPLAKDQKNEKS